MIIKHVIKGLYLLLLLLLTMFSYSQNIVIKGVIKDEKSKEVLSYANIYVKNTSVGTISNDIGQFVISIPTEFAKDSIVFPFIGSNSKCLSVKDLEKQQNNIITLKTDIIVLNEVVVKPIDPQDVLDNVVKNIHKNYNDTIQMRGFYRRVMQEDKQVTEFSEYVLDILKSPYNKYYKDKFALVEGRMKSDAASVNFLTNVENSLQIDIVKSIVLNKNVFKDKSIIYKLEDNIKLNDKLAYVISFKPNPKSKKLANKGKIIIDKESYALISYESKTDENTLKYWKPSQSNSFLARTMAKIKVVNIGLSYYKVDYQKLNNEWSLKSYIYKTSMKIHNLKTDKQFDQSILIEFVITNVYQKLINDILSRKWQKKNTNLIF